MEIIKIICPINGKELYELEQASDEIIAKAFETARSLQDTVRYMSMSEKLAAIGRVSDYVRKNRESILTRIIEETGKSRFDAMSTEIFEILDVIDYYRDAAKKIGQPKKVHTPLVLLGKKSEIWYEPMGTVLIISPWNYPLIQGIIPSILAFLAGNTVILKPSEITPLRGLIEQILDGANFPKNAIQVVYGGKEVGQKLIAQRPDKIHFTGSVATGKKIMAQASEQLIPVDLELGGKDPSIVFDDVDLEIAVQGVIWGAMTNAGQSCTSIERAYVHEKIYNKFVERAVECMKKLRPSHPNRDYTKPENIDLGAMTTEFQCKVIEEHIADAVAKGARVLVGGKREPGSRHFPPTLLVDTTHDMLIAYEETFGPVLPIMKFKDEAEAIKLANDSPYGLSASVWSKDLKKAKRVASKLKTGNVSINSHMLTEANPALPFGGVKNSGFGRYKGDEGILTFCYSKSILVEPNHKKIEAHWYPQTETKYNLMSSLIDAFFPRPRKWLGFAKVGLKLDNIGKKERL